MAEGTHSGLFTPLQIGPTNTDYPAYAAALSA